MGLFEGVEEAKPIVAEGRAGPANADEGQPPFGITWGQLVELEPRLQTMLWQARLAGAHCPALADVAEVFSPLRNELAELIGFSGKHHSHPILGSVGAYEVAYRKLYDAVAELLRGRTGGAKEAPEPQPCRR
jgi:hypothetical protein